MQTTVEAAAAAGMGLQRVSCIQNSTPLTLWPVVMAACLPASFSAEPIIMHE
jgi:hypothetical protein